MSKSSSGAGWTDAEREAMKARAEELKAEKGKGSAKKAREAQAAIDAIAEMPEADRRLAERLHSIIAHEAPELAAKTWYGMPAYTKDDAVVVFFQAAAKFGTRYATLGFNDSAALDDGAMWPTAYAVTDIGDAEAAAIAELINRAVGH